MMTRKQIAKEVEQLGYEYAEGMMDSSDEYASDDFAELYGVQLNDDVYQKASFEDLFDWIASGGDAFPEQAWSWAGDYEWIPRDGTCRWKDEEGNEMDGAWYEFESDFNAGIIRFLEEHGSVPRTKR